MPQRRKLHRIVSGCLGLVLLVPSAALGDPLDTVFESAASRLAEIPAVKGRKLALGEFRMLDGRLVEFGSFLAERLDVALIQRAATAGFEVVNRSELCQVMREWGLWMKDQADPALARKLGNLQGIQFLVSGRIADRGAVADVTLRVVDTTSTLALWGDSLRVPVDPGLRPMLSRPAAPGGCKEARPSPAMPAAPPTVAVPPQPPLGVRLWTERTDYRIDETVRFHLRTSRDAYVTLVNLGTSGQVTILFPNRFHPSHFVRGEQTITVPAAAAGFNLRIEGPPGLEQVKVIATDEPVKFHPDDFPGRKGLFRSLDGKESRVLTRDIKVEKSKASPSRWAEDLVVLRVLPKGL